MTLTQANPEQYFATHFLLITGHEPFKWQKQLFAKLLNGDVPLVLDLPTGAGKTSVMAIWLVALSRRAALPRRLFWVVDRRAVVDQATDEADRIANLLDKAEAAELRHALGSLSVGLQQKDDPLAVIATFLAGISRRRPTVVDTVSTPVRFREADSGRSFQKPMGSCFMSGDI